MDYKKLIEKLKKFTYWEKRTYWLIVDPEVGEECVHLPIRVNAATAIEALLAERNAAIEMLKGECRACKHNSGLHNIGKCGACIYETVRFPEKEERMVDNWEWRGLTEKENEERLERSDTP